MIRSEVTQVLVPFVVLDQNGRHVSGLTSSDIQVFEDGNVEQIVAFTTVAPDREPGSPPSSGMPASGSARPASLSGDLPRETYLIIVDTLHSSTASFAHVRDALNKFLGQEHTTNAQYALMALGRDVNVIQDSTSNAKLLMNAVRSDRFVRMVRDSEVSNVATMTEQFVKLLQLDYCHLCGGCFNVPERNLPGCSVARSRVQGYLTSFSETSSSLNVEFLRHLEELVRVTATMPASHTIVFISDGFNRFPGHELYSILRDGFGVRDRAFQLDPQDTQPRMEAILKRATKHNVRFYTLDSRGLYSSASLAGGGFSATSSLPQPEAVDSQALSVAHENSDALAELARETGGLFFENSNDLLKGIRQAFADSQDYYMLAYVPQNKVNDGKFRKISVSVKNGKWRVIAKTGYWATDN